MVRMRFTVKPHAWPETIAELEEAGHEFTEDISSAELLVFNGGAEDFPQPAPENIKVVQTSMAGVESLNDAGIFATEGGPRWANAAGLYADTVAESSIGMLLAQIHLLKTAITGRSFSVESEIDENKRWLSDGATVAVIGAGGIGKRLIEMLQVFNVDTIAVNRSGNPVPGADQTYAIEDAGHVWEQADYFVLIMPVTEKTHHMVNRDVLARMKPSAVVVNVGRGRLINTDDLLDALQRGVIAGAALDVTDPEPLPDGHPLWDLDNCLITPHTANTMSSVRRLTGGLAVRNMVEFERGEKMSTEIDLEAGY